MKSECGHWGRAPFFTAEISLPQLRKRHPSQQIHLVFFALGANHLKKLSQKLLPQIPDGALHAFVGQHRLDTDSQRILQMGERFIEMTGDLRIHDSPP